MEASPGLLQPKQIEAPPEQLQPKLMDIRLNSFS